MAEILLGVAAQKLAFMTPNRSLDDRLGTLYAMSDSLGNNHVFIMG